MSTFQDETYKSMIQFGTMMIKFGAAVNGGAILALLTFMGHALKSSNQIDLTIPFILYAIGLTCSGIATIFAYFTQKTLYENNVAKWSFSIAILLPIASMALFLWGSISAAFKIAG